MTPGESLGGAGKKAARKVRSTTPQSRREVRVAILLVACVALAAFWEVMSTRSRRPFQPFELTTADFETFQPASETWRIERLPVNPDPVEPNILILRSAPQRSAPPALRHAPLIVRLVHGYNMPDCMRIKHFNVELIADTREGNLDTSSSPLPYQAWRLTSRHGEVSIWTTTMLRAGDFAATDIDTRSMAFPRIGIPDHPGWFPRGLSLSSLRHPIGNLRIFLRAKWNSSRCDPLTFLGLRQPAWASDELLTLVSTHIGPSIAADDESAALRQVLTVHRFMHDQLLEWRGDRLDD